MSTTTTTIVNIKTDPRVKKKAQKVAADLGLSLSGVINGFLRQFIRTKTVHFNLEEEPSDYLVAAIEESQRDYERGDYYSFNNADDAIKFLDKK